MVKKIGNVIRVWMSQRSEFCFLKKGVYLPDNNVVELTSGPPFSHFKLKLFWRKTLKRRRVRAHRLVLLKKLYDYILERRRKMPIQAKFFQVSKSTTTHQTPTFQTGQLISLSSGPGQAAHVTFVKIFRLTKQYTFMLSGETKSKPTAWPKVLATFV